MVELEHSPLGGSGASRWMKCRPSFLLQRLLMIYGEYEELPASVFSEKGTAAHELGAMCLANALEPYEFIGEKIGNFVVHSDDLDPNAVAVYVSYCERIAAAGNGDGITMIEQTISLPEVHPLFKGTVDFAHWRLINNPGLWLIDYKNGEGVGVRAERNPQMMYYAVLLIASQPELKNLPLDFPVHLGIVQPNFYGLFEEPEIWSTTSGEILQFAKTELLPAMRSLFDDKREELPIDEFVSGDHCLFCPVMLDCPRLREAFEEFANHDEFVDMLEDHEISALYAKRKDATRFANRLEQVAFARKIAGKDIPSAKLVEKIVHRVWKGGAEDAARRQFGDKAFSAPKLLSPAQMEKISSDGKAFAIEYGFKPDSDRLTVVPIDDRRAEVNPKTNAEIFKNFANGVPQAETTHADLGWYS